MTVFWDIAPCSLAEVYRRFRGSKHLLNVGELLPDYTAQQPGRQLSSHSPPSESEISPVRITFEENGKFRHKITLEFRHCRQNLTLANGASEVRVVWDQCSLRGRGVRHLSDGLWRHNRIHHVVARLAGESTPSHFRWQKCMHVYM
jgi:hypothetical protein